MIEEKEKSTKEKKEIKLTKSQLIKTIVLGVLTLLAGLLAWFSLARILAHGLNFTGENPWLFIFDLLFPVLAFCLWVGLIGIDAIFIPKKLWLYSIYLLSIGPLFFFFNFTLYSVLSFLILLFAFFYFSHGVRKEKEDRLKCQVINFIKIHLGLTMIFCVAAVSLLFYQSLATKQESGQTKTNEAVAESAANLLNIFLETQIKTYDPNMTLDEFVLSAGQQFMEKIGPMLSEQATVEENLNQENIINEIEAAIERGEIKRSNLPPEFLAKLDQGKITAQDIIEEELTGVFQKQLTQARDDFLDKLGIEAQGTDKISEVIKKIVTKSLSEGLLSFTNYLPPLLAISLFFTLVIFDFLYVIFTKIFALLIYLVMLITKFIVIKKESKEAEVAELS